MSKLNRAHNAHGKRLIKLEDGATIEAAHEDEEECDVERQADQVRAVVVSCMRATTGQLQDETVVPAQCKSKL